MNKVGRPPLGESKQTTILIGVSREEKIQIDKEWEEFKLKNNMPKLSKSAYLRSKLLKSLS